MALHDLTAEKVQKALGLQESVPELFVLIAKHQALGLDASQIADTIDESAEEVLACFRDELYQKVKGHVMFVHSESQLSQTMGWDYLEQKALEALAKRVVFEKDSEMLLKIAAVSNKAVRKVGQGSVLNPQTAGGVRVLQLTQKFRRKLESGVVETEERKISISDGTMQNPSYEEVTRVLRGEHGNLLEPARVQNVGINQEGLIAEFLASK